MIANLPIVNNRVATAGEAITDGDTINGIAEGLFSTRFCGIDTPEKGLKIKKNDAFARDKYYYANEFTEYLKNPFDSKYPNSEEFVKALGEQFVKEYLKPKLSSDTARNHYKHALLATQGLKTLVENDIGRSVGSGKDFRFQINFPYEVLDRYDRFLGWIKRFDFSSKNESEFDSLNDEEYDNTYNIQMLKIGLAIPYFIWPNLSSSTRSLNLRQLVPTKENFRNLVINDKFISRARQATRMARQYQLGIFESSDPLILLPFELRFLTERNYGLDGTITFDPLLIDSRNNNRSVITPLFRYVIDLKKFEDTGNVALMKPNEYYKIDKVEDRLFIPPEFVPLFKEKGIE